jgi:hypothetical protein
MASVTTTALSASGRDGSLTQPSMRELVALKLTHDQATLLAAHGFAKGGIGCFLSSGAARSGIARLPRSSLTSGSMTSRTTRALSAGSAANSRRLSQFHGRGVASGSSSTWPLHTQSSSQSGLFSELSASYGAGAAKTSSTHLGCNWACAGEEQATLSGPPTTSPSRNNSNTVHPQQQRENHKTLTITSARDCTSRFKPATAVVSPLQVATCFKHDGCDLSAGASKRVDGSFSSVCSDSWRSLVIESGRGRCAGLAACLSSSPSPLKEWERTVPHPHNFQVCHAPLPCATAEAELCPHCTLTKAPEWLELVGVLHSDDDLG